MADLLTTDARLAAISAARPFTPTLPVPVGDGPLTTFDREQLAYLFIADDLRAPFFDRADPIPVGYRAVFHRPEPMPEPAAELLAKIRRQTRKQARRDQLSAILSALMPTQAELDAMLGPQEDGLRSFTFESETGTEIHFVGREDRQKRRTVFRSPLL